MVNVHRKAKTHCLLVFHCRNEEEGFLISFIRLNLFFLSVTLSACQQPDKWVNGDFIEYGDVSKDSAILEQTIPEFEGFSSGWYVLDDGIPYETTSNPNHEVTYHGDPDLYYYEPSGAHGLINSQNTIDDFAKMRNYIIERVPQTIQVSGPFNFDETSTLSTFAFATYTYFMCDFKIEPDIDVSRYAISGGAVDDGIQVMLNGHIIGRRVLNQGYFSWPLEYAQPDTINTLIVILVDDSASHKYAHDLAFTLDGYMVE